MTTSEAAPVKGNQRSFPCESCGAPMIFTIGVQKLQCQHCGYVKELSFAPDAEVRENDLEEGLAKQAQSRADGGGQVAGEYEVSCAACGAVVVFKGSLTSSNCDFCDTPLQRDKAHQLEHRIPVDGVAPFGVEQTDAGKRLREWVASRWFAPNEFKKRGVSGKFDGVYLPFFTFDAMTFTHYSGQRGDHYYVTVGSGQNQRREQRTRWSAVSGHIEEFFDDVVVPAIKSLPKKLLQGLEPWPMERLVPFTEQALAGKKAHTYEHELRVSLATGKERMQEAIQVMIRRDIGGDVQRVSSSNTNYSAMTYKHVLLPVWIMAYRYGDKPYRVVVNAVTGHVHGERPYSVPKIIAAVLAGLIVVGIVMASMQKHR
jgi:DNA-directed RNA polymerase subunit M/transcription elongation factor TFIIS